jgi:hypothetical protein
MRLLVKSSVATAVCASAVALALLTSAQAAGNHTARRADLSRRPMWVFSGAWSHESLLLVDGGRKEVDRFSVTGDFEGRVGSQKVFTRPSLLNALPGGGLLLENKNGSLVQLNDDLGDVRYFDVIQATKGQRIEIRALYHWVPLGNCGSAETGCDILAYADIHYPDHWMSAFVRIPLEKPKDFQILYEFSVDDPIRNHYLLGNPFVAAAGDDAAFLLMRENPILYYVPTTAERAIIRATLARRMARSPELPGAVAFEKVPALFSALERAPNTTGLYGANGYLYLLNRQPAEDGRTKWTISKLDSKAKVWYTLKLPTYANNLTVIPGPAEWAFLEKGAVRGMFQQEISSILFVRRDDIENFRK